MCCNINLQYFVCEWNDGYIVHSSSYMRKHSDVEYVYATGELKTWRVAYDEKEKRFRHIVK